MIISLTVILFKATGNTMSTEVKCLRPVQHVGIVYDLLKSIPHGNFPIVNTPRYPTIDDVELRPGDRDCWLDLWPYVNTANTIAYADSTCATFRWWQTMLLTLS